MTSTKFWQYIASVLGGGFIIAYSIYYHCFGEDNLFKIFQAYFLLIGGYGIVTTVGKTLQNVAYREVNARAIEATNGNGNGNGTNGGTSRIIDRSVFSKDAG